MTERTIRDEFYTGRIGYEYQPGTILRRQAVDLLDLDGASQAWQIVYATRTSFSAPIPSSAVVIAPTAVDVAGTGPTLLYCPAFHGLGGPAPSQLLVKGTEPESGFIAAALERGWTVAIADGLGSGLTGLGPAQFLVGRAAAHAVLDLARAVRDLPDLDTTEQPCVAWGFADGGRAALWAAELHHEYAKELDLRGVAAGAAVDDPGAVIPEIDGGPWAGLALAGLIGLSRAYRHLPVHHILLEDAFPVIEHASGLDAATLIAEYQHQPLGQWCERPYPWRDAIWRYVLANERNAQVRPRVPVHLYHGTEDALVPIELGRKLFAAYRALGVDLSWREYHTSHLGTATAGASEAISRLAGYLQRHPAPAPPTPPKTT
ncbi:lipase family protein [Nocardia brasiliensis]|uniref:lipase family protein n=1 Tax=Nocardia brasiliensis TaxID=37326 RepID=UPI002453F6D7|nr:lipase family protein [Nocardia brasiliensis]